MGQAPIRRGKMRQTRNKQRFIQIQICIEEELFPKPKTQPPPFKFPPLFVPVKVTVDAAFTGSLEVIVKVAVSFSMELGSDAVKRIATVQETFGAKVKGRLGQTLPLVETLLKLCEV